MMLDYFYGQSGELFAYFRIPKALFQDSRFRQLSTDARTLYGILLDRMSLSAKNSWVDEHGRVYIIYTVREVQESLCCAEHKAVKLFRELEQADLIERKRRGLGRPSLIYVKNFSSGLPKAQIYDAIEDEEGKLKRILNKTDTMLAQQKQQVIKDAFANWIWKDPQRRIALVKQYNELFNSSRPREYDGSHIHLVGMNPEITLREHQRNAIAHVLYGGNTLLAHEVGAGKSATRSQLKRLRAGQLV